MKQHDLKILPCYFENVRDGLKTFEIRKNDRDYQPGDTVFLREIDGDKGTGRVLAASIGYVTDFEQKKGWCVFSVLNVQRRILK